MTIRIKQISVSGLFGIFNHVIPLNMDERITSFMAKMVLEKQRF